MKPKQKAKSLFEREMESPGFRKRFEEGYEAFQLEVQILNALEKKEWSYSDLAEAIGTSKSNISRDLKGGGLVTATYSRIRKMAEALEMKMVAVLIPLEQAAFVIPKLEDLVRTSFTAAAGEIKLVEPPKLAAALLEVSPVPSSWVEAKFFMNDATRNLMVPTGV